MKTYGTTRGFRNHNVCNVRPCNLPDIWEGQSGIDNNLPDPPYVIFGDFGGMEADFWGIRAGARNFLSYQSKDGCQTVREIITRHAPPTDNNDTTEYIASVCKGLALSSDAPVSLKDDPGLMFALVKSVIHEEEGTDPYADIFVKVAVDAALAGV